MVKNCCNFFKHCYFYFVQTGSKRFNLHHADINFVNLN